MDSTRLDGHVRRRPEGAVGVDRGAGEIAQTRNVRERKLSSAPRLEASWVIVIFLATPALASARAQRAPPGMRTGDGAARPASAQSRGVRGQYYLSILNAYCG